MRSTSPATQYRLAKREADIKVPLKEADFRAFVLSDALAARQAALRETLAAWTRTQPEEAGRRAPATPAAPWLRPSLGPGGPPPAMMAT